MNRIYRLVFNRSLGVMQAVSEIARSHAGAMRTGGKARPAPRALAGGIGFALMLTSFITLADDNGGTRVGVGGIGGAGSFYGGGGAGGAGGNYGVPWILPGVDGAGSAGLGGPQNGPPGGAGGGVGFIATMDDTTITRSFAGGQGADSTNDKGGGGGGGSAVYANVPGGSIGIMQGVTLTGGAGGTGATNGGGGGGGAGLMIGVGTSVTSSAMIEGGAGGMAGSNSGGGGGGAGVYLAGGDASILQHGTVTGGKGGPALQGGGHGGGGAGIRGDGGNNHVVNYGTISGGIMPGLVRAHAVDFSGDDNTLVLVGGSRLVGLAVATGSNNMLVLDGTGTSDWGFEGFNQVQANPNTNWDITGEFVRTGDTSFNVAQGAYVHLASSLTGSQGLTKDGDGTLALGSIGAFGGATVVNGGMLEATNGDFYTSGSLMVNGGILALDGHSLTAGSLSGYGGNIAHADNITIAQTVGGTFAGDMDAATSINVQGSNLLVLSGTITAPILNISQAAVQIGAGGTAGTLNADVTGAGSVWFNRSDDVVFDGNVTSTGLAQVGTGILTLIGNNTPSLIDVTHGTLRLGSANALGRGVLTMSNGTTFDFGSTDATVDNTFVLRGATRFNVADGVTGSLTGTQPAAINGAVDDASMVKSGNGTLVLDSNSLDVTTTTVQAGALVVGSSEGSTAHAAGDVLVKAGATLGGHGTVDGTVSLAGGTLSPGMSQIGVLIVGGLDVENGHLAMDLGTPGTGDRLDVTGDALFAGAKLDVNDLGGMGLGVYRVINVAGNVLGSDLSLGDVPASSRLSLRYLSDEHAFDVINLGDLALNYWNADGKASSTQAGGGSGTWSAVSRNFSDAEGTVTDIMYPQPGFAVFGGAAGNVTVDSSQGDVSVRGMQFMTDGYIVDGGTLHLEGNDGAAPTVRVGDGSTAGAAMTATIASEIKGVDGLRKTDAGTLVLSGDNTWVGGVAVEGGTLSVSRDANLGDGSNDVTLDGGALRATASFDTQRNVLLGGKGGTIATNGTLALHGTLSGKGSLHKSGNGTLGLYAASDYAAGTWLDAGTLQIANGAALGTGKLTMAEGTTLGLLTDGMNVANDIVATGDPTIDVADGTSSTLSGTIADGTLPGDIVKTGTGTLRLTGENTYTGGTTVSAGTLVVGDGATHGSIRGDVVNNGTLAFDRSDDVAFAGAISGSGTIDKLGGNTLTLGGDSSAFTGDTQIEGGTLNLTGSLGGTLNIAQGATLTGAGRLGTVAIVSGSTMTPGGDDAIGTFDVAGDLNVANGSTYVVNTASTGESDTVNVAGQATIDGAAVRTLQDGGTYRASTRYTILTANGGVNGTFGSLTSDLAFLTPALAYDTNHVYLDLQRNDTRFVDLATTRNQVATATAVESQGAGAPVYDAVVTLTAAAVPPALDDLSGSSLASARAALIDDARQVRDTVQRHLLAADAAGAPAEGVWTSAWGHWGDRDASDGVARLRSNGGGVLVGADRDLGGVSVGVLGGAGNLTASSGNDSVQSKSTIAGLYAGGEMGAWRWQAGATYAWDRLDSHRHVDVAGLPGSASARYDANVAQAYVDAGYRFTVGNGSLKPFVNVARVQVSQDGLTERNSDAALQVRGEDDGVTVGTAGLRGTVAIGNAVSAHATVGYQHAWGDVRPYDTQRFVTGGDSFTVAGVPVAKDAGLLDAGLAFAIGRNATVDASYHGLFGGGAKDQGARLALNVKW